VGDSADLELWQEPSAAAGIGGPSSTTPEFGNPGGDLPPEITVPLGFVREWLRSSNSPLVVIPKPAARAEESVLYKGTTNSSLRSE